VPQRRGFHRSALHRLGAPDPAASDQGLFEATGREADRARFRTPSLRNVMEAGPACGSAPSVEAAIARHGKAYPAAQQASLLAFLAALTDRAFMANPAFALPQQACGKASRKSQQACGKALESRSKPAAKPCKGPLPAAAQRQEQRYLIQRHRLAARQFLRFGGQRAALLAQIGQQLALARHAQLPRFADALFAASRACISATSRSRSCA
jgi:hypothetical protein